MREIEETFDKNYDKLHVQFVEDNNVCEVKDLDLIRRVFEFIKSNK